LPFNEKRFLTDAVLSIAGLFTIFCSMFLGELGLTVFIVASGVAAYGCLDFAYMIHDKKLSFRRDKRGIGWVLGVAACTVVFWPFIYLFIGGPYDQLSSYILNQYTFTGTTAAAIVFVRVVISFLGALVLANVVLWAVITSKAENRGPY